MLEKPELADEQIIAALRAHYDLPVSRIEFLPIGNDATAWVYQVHTNDALYFLKVKSGGIYPPSLTVPHLLREQGINQVVAPLSTTDGALWAGLDSFALILCPYIEGPTGMDAGMSDDQWREFGTVLRRIHDTRLPPNLMIAGESFKLYWDGIIDDIRTVLRMKNGRFDDRHQQELAAFWAERDNEVIGIVKRTKVLGEKLKQNAGPFVLCHSDIHTANILLDAAGGLHLVDWDQPLLAPKERDLMFIGDDLTATTHTQTCFYEGYGDVTIDPVALAYYRYEWVVQEIGDYGERVFLMDSGDETKADSVRGFRQLFDPGDVVEIAYATDEHVPPGI